MLISQERAHCCIYHSVKTIWQDGTKRHKAGLRWYCASPATHTDSLHNTDLDTCASQLDLKVECAKIEARSVCALVGLKLKGLEAVQRGSKPSLLFSSDPDPHGREI